MLTIGKVDPSRPGYYLDRVATSPEAYYLGDGDASGVWEGTAAGGLGLSGEVDPEAFTRLLDGRHPDTDGRLVPAAAGRVGAFDLTFSAPKSVSLLWVMHPGPQVRHAVAEAHRAAIGDALAYLETHALWARRGHNGTRRVPVSGLVAARFDHRTSREGDPQLHSHVVAANLACDHAGRWSAPDGAALFRHARTAGFVYQARLRHELTRSLGVAWGPVRTGQADLAGVTREQVEAFSTRRHQVTAALAERGLSSMAASRVAVLDTRPAKPAPDRLAGFVERWQTVGADLGLDLSPVVHSGRVPLGADPEQLTDRLLGPAGLTAYATAFDRATVVRELAASHPDGTTLANLEALTDRVLANGRAVDLGPDETIGDRRRWTTVDLLTLEADLATQASTPWATGGDPPGAAGRDAIDRALAERPQLSDEQQLAVIGITRSEAPVVAVVGKAGTGKTFTLDAARAAWTNQGVPVVGAAPPAARAAAELQVGSGIPSTTLARLLTDIDQPEGRLRPRSVIVVDEAGMVGTRDLHHLVSLARHQEAKVVLVGDHRQLPEIAAGGSFARLTGQVPTHTLSENRRQHDPWERAALDRLRDHQPGPALARYGTEGRITLADTAEQLRDRMVTDWHHARQAGRDTIMLAVRRADVTDLNQRAQAALIQSGRLDGEDPSVEGVGGVRVLVGDEIVCGRNDRRAGLTNGTRLTVTHLDPDTKVITGRGPDGSAVTVPGDYVAEGHVALGYASTVHKAQGRTVDVALLLGDDRLFAEAGYVGLSRGRARNQLYVVATPPLDRAVEQPGSGLVDHVCTALGASRAHTLASAQAADRIPDAPLPALVTERDRLLGDLLTGMPPAPDLQPATGPGSPQRDLRLDGLAERDAWTAGHRRDGERLARLTVAIDQRTQRLGLAATLDPPEHLTRLLGPVPDEPALRRSWAETASDLEAWRELSRRSPDKTSRHLLAEPAASDPAHGWWQQAAHSLAHHQHHLPHDLPGLDRAWQPTQEQGLSL